MKKMYFLFLFIIILALPACIDDKVPNIDGAWKTKKLAAYTEKPYTLIFDGKKLYIGKNHVNIELKKKDDVILVTRTGETEPIYTIVVKDKDILEINNFTEGMQTYYRTTVDDVHSITNADIQPTMKDPF